MIVGHRRRAVVATTVAGSDDLCVEIRLEQLHPVVAEHGEHLQGAVHGPAGVGVHPDRFVGGGAEGQAVEVEIAAKQILRTKDKLNKLLAKHTGQSLAKVEKDTDRDFWLNAEEAKEYGIVDEIIKNK